MTARARYLIRNNGYAANAVESWAGNAVGTGIKPSSGIADAVLSGALDLPDYEQRRADYLDCSWLPPRWDWVDPLKDIRAEINAIEAGLKSRTQAIAERGFDAAMVDAEIARDYRREDSLGLRYRKLELSVEIIASGDAAAEEADVLAQAVEAILDADETLGLLVEGTRLTRTEVDQGGEGDTPVLAVRLSFEVSYWTKPVINDGVLPLQVLVSWVPEIGVSHEHSYQPVDTHYREPSS